MSDVNCSEFIHVYPRRAIVVYTSNAMPLRPHCSWCFAMHILISLLVFELSVNAGYFSHLVHVYCITVGWIKSMSPDERQKLAEEYLDGSFLDH
jgi:nitrate reductase gamma subunit